MKSEKKHFVIAGPESSGKTTLFNELKKHFDGIYIEEYARQFLTESNNEYKRNDLRTIAFRQFQHQLSAYNSDEKLIISDTDLLNIVIWDEFKFGQMDDFILEWYQLQRVDFYLLCKPDLDWEEDPMRENPDDRDRLFELHQAKILEMGIPYKVISGVGKVRNEAAVKVIEKLLEE